MLKAPPVLKEDVSLSDVAFCTGFYDQSHFTKAFKDAEGQTPGAYQEERKDLQEEDTQRNFWLTAEEAKNYGLVGHIVESTREIPRGCGGRAAGLRLLSALTP